ncbi:MAG: MerR family transcriptional regulator [Acidimicrobiales bacterium]
MERFTVSEVASRTGFSSSALRYYDDVGLVRPIGRSDAGYRLYDDRSVELLRFVARAKRLGLNLDDITDLVALWNTDECAPVQTRLADLVEIKLLDTQQAIRELTEFAAQLTGLRERLREPASAGACDDNCACNVDPAVSRPGHVRFGRTRTNATAGVPVVCDVSSAPDTVKQRIEAYRQLFADAFIDRQHTVAGNRFRFRADAGIEARVRRLADLEKQCCAFFDFTITLAGGEVLWDTTVIDDDVARAVLAEWFDLPETSEHGVKELRDRMVASGLQFTADPVALS